MRDGGKRGADHRPVAIKTRQPFAMQAVAYPKATAD
jgi:hypothetical protein